MRDPFAYYVDVWMITTDTPRLVEGLQNEHLFDALLLGDWGLLAARPDNDFLMYQLYPCGMVFMGGKDDSIDFDNSFAGKSYSEISVVYPFAGSTTVSDAVGTLGFT